MRIKEIMKKILSALSAVLLPVILTLTAAACGAPEADAVRQIYASDEKIATPYSSYAMSGGEQQINGQSTSGSFEQFNGMVMFWSYYLEQETALDVRYEIRVKQGRVKLVLVDPDFEVITIDEITNQTAADGEEVHTMLLGEGTTFLKLVGTDDAQVEFKVSIREGDFYTVK